MADDRLWLVGGDFQVSRQSGRVEIQTNPSRNDQHGGAYYYDDDGAPERSSFPTASLERSEAEQLRDWLDRFLGG